MKSAVHQYEDKLLEFAYGELPRAEADAVEAHVRGCPRCSQALDEIRGVRVTMAQLPMVAAPDAGLDSLLAYAEQAAKRNATATAKPSTWRRFLAPLVTVMALATVGVIGLRANQEFDTSPASAAADSKMKELEEGRAKKDVVAQAPAPDVAPVAAAPQPHPAPPTEQLGGDQLEQPLQAALGTPKEAKEEEKAEGTEAVANKKGGKAPAEAGATPQSITRRNVAKTVVNDELAAAGDAEAMDGKKAPPPPPLAKNAPMKGELKEDPNVKADWGNARGGYVQSKDSLLRDATKSPAKPTAKPQLEPRLPEEPSDGWSDKTAARQKQEQKQEKQFKQEDAPAPAPTYGLTGGLSSSAGPSNASTRNELAAKDKDAKAAEEKRRAEADTSVQPQAEAYRPAPSAPPAATAPAPVQPAPKVASVEKKKSKSDSMSMPFGMSSTGSSSPGRSSVGSGGASLDEDTVAVQSGERERADNTDDRKMQQQSREMASDLIEQARVASGRGDRSAEIQLAGRALQLGATGYTRVEALKRLCDALDAIGEPERADPYCAQLLREFPGTAAAQQIAQKRNVQRVSPSKKKAAPAPVDRKAYEFDEQKEPKPADAAPALQSY